MRFMLLLAAALFAFITFALLGVSKSAIHEILAAVCALTSVCAFGMAAILEAITKPRSGPPQ